MEQTWQNTQFRHLNHYQQPNGHLNSGWVACPHSCKHPPNLTADINQDKVDLSGSASDQKWLPCSKTATSSTLGGSKSSDLDSRGSRSQQRSDPSEETVYNSFLLEEPDNREMKKSLIDDLAELVKDEPVRSVSESFDKKTTLFQCIEEQSLHDEESNEDHLSEVMELTPEEQDFFSSFKLPSAVVFDLKPTEQHQRQASLTLSPVKSRVCGDLPDNKKKVIRNFFKPKAIQAWSADKQPDHKK